VSRLCQYAIAISLAACGLLAGCSEKPKPTGPKFSGRVLLLTGQPPGGPALAELTAKGDGYNLATITAGVNEAVPSPDQAHLLFATKEEISVRDLANGTVKSLVKGESICLGWAPNGNHFSYQQRSGGSKKSFVSDLAGTSKMILDDTNGSTDCPQWIAKDRLVLDRFVGRPTNKGTETLKPNTSTVVTVAGSVTLKDSPRKWSVVGVCAKSNNGFVRAAEGGLMTAKNIDHFESLDPAPISCSECRFIGYAAQSCVPFFIEQPASTTSELFYLNPTNWQKQRPASISWTFSPDARFLINSSARLMVAGDAPDKLLLIDTETGDVTPFFRNEEAKKMALISPVPVVWIEK
jgi:hypothetical protein